MKIVALELTSLTRLLLLRHPFDQTESIGMVSKFEDGTFTLTEKADEYALPGSKSPL